ncbi:MAG: GTP-binding protein [Alloacidobacterium sp.]|jgi:Ni2+-binding GTPase involved in maturation of urease and hydrogenase
MNAPQSAQKPWVVVVGGFLGAGKTSLILAASRLLAQGGVRSAVILNDQGKELVDTRHAEMRGITSGEVTGGCFCCKFSELIAEMEKMRSLAPDVIFAEPVGSCTDLVATVLSPLLQEFDSYRIAPLTVLVDPARTAALLSSGADANAAFLFRKQLQEADLVCMTKTDIFPDAVAIPDTETRYVSAKTGQGVLEWMDEILSGSFRAAARTLDIDYEQYARAEAALAWLNLSFTFEPESPTTSALVIGPFMDRLDDALTAAAIPIAHLKIMDSSPAGWLKAATCANGEEPILEGDLAASPTNTHELVLNLRATGSPIHVREIVEKQLKYFVGKTYRVRLDCFSPAPPKPEGKALRPTPR